MQGLRDRAPRSVELTFRRPVDPTVLTRVPGVTLQDTSGTTVRLTVAGAVGPVATAAAALDLVDVVATPADLDELFRTFYARPPSSKVEGVRAR